MSASEAGTIELRPDLSEYRALLRSRLWFGIPIIALLVLRVMSGGALGAVIVVAALAVLGAVGAVHIRTSRILLTPTTIEHRGAVVRDRVIRFDDARGVLGVMSQSLASDTRTLVVQSVSTGRSMRVFGGLWNDDQLQTIARTVGVEELTQPISGTAMDAYAPGSIPLRYRRPMVFAVAIGLVLFPSAGLLAYLLSR